MKPRKFPLLLVLGLCLVLAGVLSLAGLQLRLRAGAQESQKILEKLDAILPERTVGVPEAFLTPAMPVLEIDGVDCVAILDVPGFGVTLPVTAQWDTWKLTRSPARFYGSIYDGSLIIGGFDDPRQFGFCGQIQHGATITLTDTTGQEFTYQVARVDRAKSAEAQWLTDPTWDLTLFCHDLHAMEYIAVRCAFAYGN